MIKAGRLRLRGRLQRQGILRQRQQPADPARALQRSAQVIAPRQRQRRQVVPVPVLEDNIAVINKVNFICLCP